MPCQSLCSSFGIWGLIWPRQWRLKWTRLRRRAIAYHKTYSISGTSASSWSWLFTVYTMMFHNLETPTTFRIILSVNSSTTDQDMTLKPSVKALLNNFKRSFQKYEVYICGWTVYLVSIFRRLNSHSRICAESKEKKRRGTEHQGGRRVQTLIKIR